MLHAGIILGLSAVVITGCTGLDHRTQREPQRIYPDDRSGDQRTPRGKTTADPPTCFQRIVDVGRWECVAQTAVVTYVNEAGVSVSLVAAHHWADPKHYHDIQARLAAHQLVLYEGWADEPRGEEKTDEHDPHLMRFAMRLSFDVSGMLEAFLGFRHVDQWDAIDYSPVNFENTDMSLPQFKRLCRDRREDLVQLGIARRLLPAYAISALIRSMPCSDDEFRRLIALPDSGFQAARYLYARENVEAGNLLGAFHAGRDAPSDVTIHSRNDLVEDVLFQRLSAGARDVAIYYGAVHMPDLERRLRRRGFRKTSVEWLDCWDVRHLK